MHQEKTTTKDHDAIAVAIGQVQEKSSNEKSSKRQIPRRMIGLRMYQLKSQCNRSRLLPSQRLS